MSEMIEQLSRADRRRLQRIQERALGELLWKAVEESQPDPAMINPALADEEGRK